MRIRGNRVATKVVQMGTVRITYLPNQIGDRPKISGVTREQFERLHNVVQSHRELTQLRGQRKTHPNEHARWTARDMLNLPQSTPETLSHKSFTVTTHVIKRGYRRRVVADQTSLVLHPWQFASVEFTDVVNVTVTVPA